MNNIIEKIKPDSTLEMKIFILIVLGILDLASLGVFLYLWRSSQYPGAEIGNMDWGLAKVFGMAALGISVLITLIFMYKK